MNNHSKMLILVGLASCGGSENVGTPPFGFGSTPLGCAASAASAPATPC